MLFNSIEFALFLPIVFFIYWTINNKNLKMQNAFLLVVSYIFYGWWDYRFLSLIFFSSLVDFIIGLKIPKAKKINTKKLLLATSIAVNLGLLGFFKYYNFFIDSFHDAFTLMGNEFNYFQLNIILPVGISFYTFQTMSYSLDIYKGRLEPTRDLIAFFAFVSYFPQLVAGPIERASNLLPQFYKKRTFDYDKAVDGVRQILWGLFKKIVIADNCAHYVNEVFSNYQNYPGSSLIFAGILFSVQIYGDFSGYSDIAIGTSRLFGFNLMRNFAYPYFSRDIAEFWRRWHISLSTWFRDYLYIPLGGSRGNLIRKIRNVLVVFVVSGFWHGANWTFIFWGFLNAMFFLPLMLFNVNKKNSLKNASDSFFPPMKNLLLMVVNFTVVTMAFVFFRSATIMDGFNFIGDIFTRSTFSFPEGLSMRTLFFVAVMFLVEWIQRRKEHGLELSGLKYPVLRPAIYYALIFTIIWFGGNQATFIYFQF